MTNKLVLHGCGGCGINQTSLAKDILSNLGEGFANVVDSYIDTTDKNFQYLTADKENTFSVSDNSYKGNKIDGAGGERRTNYKQIQVAVKEYLDARGIKEHDNGVYHVVLFSAGGGSGSIIGPVLAKSMIERGIPTLVVVTGDMETGNLAQNTSNTLATLQSFVKMTNKPLAMFYVNNKTSDGKNITERETNADKTIVSFLTCLSMFVSGENFSLDNQDMNSFFDFTSITSIKLPVGVFVINVYSGMVKLKDGIDAFIGRTLTKDDIPPDPGIDLVHWKAGKITKENIGIAVDFPIHIVLTTGLMFKEDTTLKKRIKELRDTVNSIRPDQLEEDSESVKTDDGLVI